MTIVLVILSLSVLILAHELGHFIAARGFGMRVEEFGIGFPPRLWGKKKGDTVYSLNALPFGGFVRITGEHSDASSAAPLDTRSFIAKAVWQRLIVMFAGVFANFLAGWLIISAVLVVGIPEHLMITDVLPESPASVAGLERGDVVLSAVTSAVELLDPISTEDFIAALRDQHVGTVELTIARGSETLTLSIIPRANPTAEEGAIGAGVVSLGAAPRPVFESLLFGMREAAETTWRIVGAFISFFGGIVSDPGIVNTVAGPVGIVTLAGQAHDLGFVYFLQLMALISLNLTVLNLIPFPALDGGRIVLLLIEKIKGGSISLRIQRAVNAFGFVILVLLMIVITIKDVARLF